MADPTPPDRKTPERPDEVVPLGLPAPGITDDHAYHGIMSEDDMETGLLPDRYTDRSLDVHRPARDFFTAQGARVRADSDPPVFHNPTAQTRRVEVMLWLAGMGVSQQMAEHLTRKGGHHFLHQRELAGLIPESIEQVIEGLRHAGEGVREFAAVLLSYARDQPARVVPALLRARAEDVSARVRSAAARALAKLGPPKRESEP